MDDGGVNWAQTFLTQRYGIYLKEANAGNADDDEGGANDDGCGMNNRVDPSKYTL